jgi:hypothetical protein
MVGYTNLAPTLLLLLVAGSGLSEKDSPVDVPGVRVVRPGSKIVVDRDKLFGGNALNSLVSSFENDPQLDCLQLAGLFSVTPHGVSIILPARRDELRFEAQEDLESASKVTRTIGFVTPVCRLTIGVEKQIKSDTSWISLIPTD